MLGRIIKLIIGLLFITSLAFANQNNDQLTAFDGTNLVILNQELQQINNSINNGVQESAWTDYTANSNIVGWSSFSQKYIYTKTIGSIVFVNFHITGTSNSVTTSFTVPYSMFSLVGMFAGNTLLTTVDNGVGMTTPGRCYITLNNVVQLETNCYGGVWTASGTKEVLGNFWYQSQ